MFEVIALEQGQLLKLPSQLAHDFHTNDRFIVWREGDTLHFKRLVPDLFDQIAQLPSDDAPSLDDLDDLVHQ